MIQVSVPGSKSITNRVLLISALAKGKTIIKNALLSDDTSYMIHALNKCGGNIKIVSKKGSTAEIVVNGIDGNFKKASRPIYCGNAGTAMRFLTATLATQKFASKLDGNARMRVRPIGDLAKALSQLGANVETSKGYPPIKVQGPFTNNSCAVRGNVSSQFLSGLLLAAPLSEKDISINIKDKLTSKPYVDMSILLMRNFGVKVSRVGNKRFIVKERQYYKAVSAFNVEPDASSASYFVGISVLTGEKIIINNLTNKSIQADATFIKVARSMTSNNSNTLRAVGKINCSDFPDAAMTLALLCAFAKGKSILTGLSNLKVKESDRLDALQKELTRIGCRAIKNKDGLTIFGDPTKLHGAEIETYDDHRIAMCFGMASVVIPNLKIKNPECVNKTYPTFWKDLNKVKKQLNDRNIVLIGMRGSGKSSIGRHIAKQLSRKFLDIDREIERIEKKSISEIVKQKGWKYFRDVESSIVKKITQNRRSVIATGGGVILRKQNVTALKANSAVVLLESSVKSLKKRLKKSEERPSLTGINFLDELEDIYESRKTLYKMAAELVIDVSRDGKNMQKDITDKAKIIQKSLVRLGIHV